MAELGGVWGSLEDQVQAMCTTIPAKDRRAAIDTLVKIVQ